MKLILSEVASSVLDMTLAPGLKISYLVITFCGENTDSTRVLAYILSGKREGHSLRLIIV